MSAAMAKKNGKPSAKDYLSDAFTKQLGPLIAKLAEEAPDARYDAKAIGALVTGLLQFQDDALGANSLPPRAFPKVPLALFEDVRPGGGLSVVLTRLAAIKKTTPEMKNWEWNSVGSRRFNLDSLTVVRADLQRTGLLKSPVVAAHPTCGAERERALEAARKLQATVVEDPADPSVTHVLYPAGALCIGDEDIAGTMRTLQTSGQRARIHWRFLPPSYAEWVPLRSAPQIGAERSEPPGGKLPWRVTLQWALDSEKYNEWMHPLDYEADEQKAKSIAAAEAAAMLQGAEGPAKRPAAAAQLADPSLGPKRRRGGDEVDPGDPGEEVAPGVVRRRLLAPRRPAAEGVGGVENVSQGQLDPTATVPAVEPPPSEGGQQQQQQQQQQGGGDDGGKSIGSRRYLLPMHAAWFSSSAIHAHERRGLPELTNGSVPGFNVKTYTVMRNSLVSLYRRQPERRLTPEEAVDKLRGDFDPAMLHRVHGFLDGWGIINWLALRTQPTAAAAALPAGTQLAPSQAVPQPQLPPGHVLGGRALAAAARLLQLRMPTTAEGVAAASAGGTLTTVSRESRGSRLESSTSLAAGPRRFFCNAFPWIDCTALRYHCTRAPGVDLSPEAYAEGRFLPGLGPGDFVRLEGGADAPTADAAAAQGKWTPQETLLLLEALDTHGDNWSAVAEAVGTHGVLDCITHFLQLPVEDDFLDELEGRAAAGGRARSTAAADAAPPAAAGGGGAAIGRVPLAGTDAAPGNPVIGSLSLISVVLAPRIAAEAAQAALTALASDDPVAMAARLEAARLGEDAPDAAGESMDVDGANEGAPPDPSRPVTAEHARGATVVALAAAAARAKLMADEQTGEMERLVQEVIKVEKKRVHIKNKYLRQVDEVLDGETQKLMEVFEKAGGGVVAGPGPQKK